MVSSRSLGRQGAIAKPQLPMMAVVTPRAGEGRMKESQVIWASKCVCESMMPGISARPDALTQWSEVKDKFGPMPTIFP